MAEERPTLRFFGDLVDPWVAAIADALPSLDGRDHCPDLLPDGPPGCAIAVVHRAILGPTDSDRMADWRKDGTRVILCIGPHVRARDLERASASTDLVLPESTASETIARHVLAPESASERAILPLVAVVAQGFEIRRMLVESCTCVGFPARGFATWDDATPSRLALWDAPVLEPNWARGLVEPSRRRSVVAMIGFAVRRLVAEAREAGASACLDFPCDLADLAFVLTRLADRAEVAPATDGPHLVPPPRMGLRVVRPPVADRSLRP